MTRPRDLFPDEAEAIARFAKAEGRSWKHKLAAVYWYNARMWRGPGSQEGDGALLHGLRNDPRWGHHGLDLYKLPRPERAA